MKEVKRESQGSGFVTWVNHEAICQEGKDMGCGRAGTSQESENQEVHCGCVPCEILVGLSRGDLDKVIR